MTCSLGGLWLRAITRRSKRFSKVEVLSREEVIGIGSISPPVHKCLVVEQVVVRSKHYVNICSSCMMRSLEVVTVR